MRLSRFWIKQLLITAVLTAIAATLLWWVFGPAVAAVAAVASLAWVETIYLLRESRDASLRYLRRHEEKLSESAAVLSDVANRARRTEPIIRDTAGSIGRAAPVIRSIAAQVGTPQQSQAQAPGGKLPHALPVASPVEFARESQPRRTLRVAIIADEFTERALSYEWEQLPLTPLNWRAELESFDPDLLFVESAWEGNGGAWRYHLVGASAPRPAVQELVHECRERGITTVFWNKEDPPHYEEFLPTARLFDHVATTDGDIVDRYRHDLGHDRIHTMPFAAQPALHNPARLGTVLRDRDVVFGGMYFRHKYPERRAQLSFLLPAAAKFGFDIYSRQDGKDPKYSFPEAFTHFVRGSLSYEQMVAAYHAYKVVLNVNSVVGSHTMCARRILEATACGAAVVSPPSEAIPYFYGDDELTVVEGEEEAYDKIRALLRSDDYRTRKVHAAQRRTWNEHTYEKRIDKLLAEIGLPNSTTPRSASVIVSTHRPHEIENVFANIARQTGAEIELVLLTHGFEMRPGRLADLRSQYGVSCTYLSAPSTVSLGSNLNRLVDHAEGNYILRMDDDDWYGRQYVHDMMHAIDFSGADMVGKAASYIYLESMNATILTYPAHEHRYTDFIRGATMSAPAETFTRWRFPEIGVSEDSGLIRNIRQDGGTIYSADRFNFLVNRSAGSAEHTWRTSDAKLFGSGIMKYVGRGVEQIDV